MEEEKKQNQTIEQITKSYEEKIAEREKQVLQEKEQIKKDMQAEFEKEKKQIQETHNKEIADIIMGRKSAQEVQNNDEENDKSFFDKLVEKTKQKLGITKGEKK